MAPVTLSFTAVGAPAQDFIVSDPGATLYIVSSSNTAVATVFPGGGPGTEYAVSTNTSTGTASITITDNAGGAAVVSVGVGVSPLIKKHHPPPPHKATKSPAPNASPTPRPRMHLPINPKTGQLPGPTAVGQTGALNVIPSSIALIAAGASQTVAVSESGYSRIFAVSSSNSAVATASVTQATGPSATVAISAHAAGSAIIRIADDHGGVQSIVVVVRAAQPATPHGRVNQP